MNKEKVTFSWVFFISTIYTFLEVYQAFNFELAVDG